jgi:plastocyanin
MPFRLTVHGKTESPPAGGGETAPARVIPAVCNAVLAAALALAVAGAACSSSSPSTTPTPAPVAGTTITITSSGTSPKNLQISPGTQVTFINNDSRNHEMDSDPHPDHTDCPAINQVGPIAPGQSKQTGNLNTIRSCGYHDHNDAQNPNWQGRITIQ